MIPEFAGFKILGSLCMLPVFDFCLGDHRNQGMDVDQFMDGK
jgi:hypothetical protein